MKIDELMGSLQTYEMNQNLNRRDKGLALKVKSEKSQIADFETDFEEELGLLTKNFERMIRKFVNKRPRFNRDFVLLKVVKILLKGMHLMHQKLSSKRKIE